MLELLAGDQQVPMPADQLRPAPSRNPLRHSRLRVLSHPTLIAKTIPFIPAIRFIRLQKNFNIAHRHRPADPGKSLLGWK
jgi:hypothetical protein